MDKMYRIAVIVVVVVAVGVGAFFAGRETAPTTTAPTTTTAPPTTTTSAPTTTTSAPTTTTVSVICQPTQLHIAQSGSSGAAGTIERTFSLANISSTTCRLYGYPGMLLLGPGATAEPTNVVRGGGLSFENIGPSMVTLAPGTTAYFNVGYSDVTTVNTTCSTATAVEVTPPTDTSYSVVTVSPIEACDNGTLHVSAVFGSTDTAATQTTAPS